MLVYGVMTAIVYILSVLAAKCSRAARGFAGRTPDLTLTLLAFAVLALVAGLRYNTGTDYWNYTAMYSRLSTYGAMEDSKDIAFVPICKFLQMFTPQPWLFFLTWASATCLLMVLTLRKYARPFGLAMLLYITSLTYFFCYNGVRQALAASIIFAGSGYLFDRKPLKFAIVVLVASLFHASALVFMPVYLIAHRKPLSMPNLLVLAFFLGAFFMYGGFVSSLFSHLEGRRFEGYTASLLDVDQGANILRFLVHAAILVAALLARKRLEMLRPGLANPLINVAFLGTMVMLLSVRHQTFARLAFYFGSYELILVPSLVYAYGRRNFALAYTCIGLPFLAYAYLVIKSGDSHLAPYLSIFSR